MGFRVLEGARIVGDVRIGDGSSVWYNAVLRGDLEPIEIGRCSNIQDNCVVHTSRGYPVRVGDCVSVGHAAVLHGTLWQIMSS
jgi:Carbonic anhydrases/acetyltransferases, isoleucine patch superfamily